MTPELIQGGVMAALLVPVIVFLGKTLRAQYESRIERLEMRATQCERDREALHRQMAQVLQACGHLDCPAKNRMAPSE